MALADLRTAIGKPSFITVIASYTDRDRMTMIPGSSHQRDSTWKVPLSWASCLALRGVFGRDLEIGPALLAWAKEEKERVDRLNWLRLLTSLPHDDVISSFIDEVELNGKLQLRPFQRADVAYLVEAGHGMLLTPMGGGKTGVTIRSLQVLRAMGYDPFPAVVIAPNSVKASVWPAEAEKWAPELSLSVVDGSASLRRKQIEKKADVTVINWEAVRLHSRVTGYGDIRLTDKDRADKELNWLAPKTVIADEAHRLKDPATAQSRAVRYLLHQAEYRWLLTGTPVPNGPDDFWGLMNGVAPAWHPGKTRYIDRYLNVGYSLWGGMTVLGLKADTEPEFRAVTEPLYRRLPKEVILPQLPPVLPDQVRYTYMSPKQAKLYKQMEEKQLAMLDQLLVAGSPLVALRFLLQFAAAAADEADVTVDEDGKPHYHLKMAEPSGKVDDLVELLDELGEEPLVVAAESRQLVELACARLQKLGISHGKVTGGMTASDRADVVRRFQAGQDRVILLVLAAGAEGLTLTRSRVLLFMQESWQAELNDQARGRIHRIGSEVHESVQYIRQVTPGTVEERKPVILAGKAAKSEEVLQDRETIRRLLGG